MEIIYKKTSELIPYEKNPRKNDAAVDYVAESIKQFKFKVPIIIDKNNVIVAGHTRLKAALKLGMDEVPCIVADDLDEEQIKAFRLADNRVAEFSGWDVDLLLEELEDLKDFDLEGLGFEEFLLEPEEPIEAHDDDFDEDDYIPEVAAAEVGDVYVLGRHRLVCGDCKNAELVDKLTDGAEIDFVITDPPYGINYTANGTREGIENDALSDDVFETLIHDSYENMYNHMKPGANIFVFHSDSKEPIFRGNFEKVGFKYHQTWQWVKQSLVLGHGWAHYQNEPILVGWKEGAAHFVTGRRDLSTVLKFDRPTTSKEHPTMKPLDLLGFLINEGSKRGDNCLDLFGGSGSTLIACEQLDRTCYTMELDPKYADVIVKRYVRYTGSAKDCYLIRDGKQLPLPQDITALLN